MPSYSRFLATLKTRRACLVAAQAVYETRLLSFKAADGARDEAAHRFELACYKRAAAIERKAKRK